MFQDIVIIISGGCLYAVITLGLGLLVSLMGLMNFAYGELIMVGGFAAYLARDLPTAVMLAVVVGAVVLVSLLSERLAFRPLRSAEPLTLLVGSFAVSIILQNIARMTVGSEARGVAPHEFLQQNIEVGGALIQVLDLVTIAATVLMLVGLLLLMRRSTLGMQLRAAAEDFEMARVLGVKANRVIASAFAITGLMAGVVSLILMEDLGAVTPTTGSTPVLIAFVGLVIGGMGSLYGAVAGGFLLGAATAALDIFLPNELVPFRDAFLFTAMIGVLVVRPNGLVPSRTLRAV